MFVSVLARPAIQEGYSIKIPLSIMTVFLYWYFGFVSLATSRSSMGVLSKTGSMSRHAPLASVLMVFINGQLKHAISLLLLLEMPPSVFAQTLF